ELLKILHPFMPFVTEELWQNLDERKDGETIMLLDFPEADTIDEEILTNFDYATNVITEIRNFRKSKNIANKDKLELKVKLNEGVDQSMDAIISKLTNLSELSYVEDKVEGAYSFVVKSNEYFIPLAGNVDVAAELEKLNSELEYAKGLLAIVDKKLANEKFVNGAPEQVVANEKKKKADAEAKIKVLEEQLMSLK